MVRINAAQSDLPPCVQGQISSSVIASSKQAAKNRACPSMPSKASAAGDIALNSSWIKRLKSRDESAVMRSSGMEVVPELVRTLDEDENLRPLCHLPRKSSTNRGISTIDLATPDSHSGQNYTGASRQSLTTGKETTGVTVVSGFGPWSRRSSRSLDGKEQVVQGTTNSSPMPAVDISVSLGLTDLGKQVDDMTKTSFASSNSPDGEASTLLNNKKPPLPHLPGKSSRPETGYLEGLSVSLGNSLNASEQKDAACANGPMLHTQGTNSSKVTPVIEVVREKEEEMEMISKPMDVRNASRTHLILTLPKKGTSKLTDGQNVTQNARKGHKLNSSEELLSEDFIGNAETQRPNGGGLESPQSSTTTASFPWEMFVQAAGASNLTREQFAQVYNRAHYEPESQRIFNCIERDAQTKIDEDLRLSSKPNGRNPDLLPEMRHLEDHVWLTTPRGRFTTLNVGSRHKAFDINGGPLHVPPRTIEQIRSEQRAASFVNGQRQELMQNTEILPCVREFNGRETPFSAAKGHDKEAIVHADGLHTKDDGSQCKSLARAYAVSDDRLETTSTRRSTCKQSCQAMEEVGPSGKNAATTALRAGSTNSREGLPIRYQVWLQRWLPTKHAGEGMTPRLPLHVKGQNDRSLQSKEADVPRFPEKGARAKYTSSVKERGWWVAESPGRRGLPLEQPLRSKGPVREEVLPSAAAMAIVGSTTTRQPHMVRLERRGPVAFWSGFGLPPALKMEAKLKGKP